MEKIFTFSAESRNNLSGTLTLPIIAAQLDGKCGRGQPLILKIGSDHYQANKHQTGPKGQYVRTRVARRASRLVVKWPDRLVHHNQTGPKGQYIRTKNQY